ncbi:MAG: hypothetical protein CL916_06755 [Deltaproteobacteria bacterium]|nr:hypothetical protein [Deltaproteobacteria bacterium]
MNWEYGVLDEEGRECVLSSLFPKSWCILVLFRHSECMECNLLAHELNELQGHLRKWGVSILGVGNGEVSSLHRLRTRLGISRSVVLCSHVERKVHKDLKLYDSFWRAWGLKAMWNTIKGFQQGHIQTSMGFPMGQQSGVVLLNPHREILWVHRSKFLGDIPTQSTILEQVLLHIGE